MSDSIHDLARIEDLFPLKDWMVKEVGQTGNVVSRYMRLLESSAAFNSGRVIEKTDASAYLNKEDMSNGLYKIGGIPFLVPDNFELAKIQRDIYYSAFNFRPKGIDLPTDNKEFIQKLPEGIDMFDEELKEFSKEHKSVNLIRSLFVEQRINVNSGGGCFVQQIPFLRIIYEQGYVPIITSRSLSAVCSSESDVKKITNLIKCLPDPTLDKRIRNSSGLSEAFHELYNISKLKYGYLKETKLNPGKVHDVIVLSGIPVHEIFGHHFEEQVRLMNFGESNAFELGQQVNNDIIMSDNPSQKVGGLRVVGFTNIDAYGRERKERTHIKNNEVVGFLGSEYIDTEMIKNFYGMDKSDFVGNASQFIDGCFPQARMSCTVLDGRTEKLDHDEMEKMIHLVSNSGHTNNQEKTYQIDSSECYVIEDGEPKRLLPLQINGAILPALEQLVLLDEFIYDSGVCGKSNPININQTAKVPVSEFARNQLWKNQQVTTRPIHDYQIKILKSPNLMP